jgi:hypothetical protein
MLSVEHRPASADFLRSSKINAYQDTGVDCWIDAISPAMT